MYPERDRQSGTAEAARRLSRFREALRKAGVRMTPQRMGIFVDVVRSIEHPDAESIHKRVRRRMPGVSLDTVYRNLWLLNDLGLITTVGPYREKARFDGRAGSHPHFVCKKCGKVFDIGVRAPAGREVRDAARVLGRVDQVRVEFIGLCRQCLPLTDTPKMGRIARKGRKG